MATYLLTITGVSAGEVDINVQAENEGNINSKSIHVVVEEPPETTLELSKTELEMFVGETTSVTATSNGEVTATSLSEDIASVTTQEG